MSNSDFDFVLPMMKLIQDFVPYNESKFWDLSKEYYQGKGIVAWSDTAPKIIPHKSGSNYQNAINLLALIKKLQDQGLLGSKVRILECGAGSGRFSRHLLLAARDQAVLNNIELFVSDYAQKNLEEIHSKGILTDIKETEQGKHYHLINLDITAIDQAKTLQGKTLELGKFDVIFMHFIYDALPLTILRKTTDGKLEELYISLRLRKDLDISVITNDFVQARMHKEFEWRAYDWASQSPWEIEFRPVLEKYLEAKKPEAEIFYHYTGLKATQQLMSILNPQGFLFSSDIRPEQEKNSLVVGNAVAHEVDNEFIAASSPNYHSEIITDDKISRIIFSASESTTKALKNEFAKFYGPDNNVQAYIDLENQIESLIEAGLAEGLLSKLELLEKLAPYNARTFWLKAKYYELLGDKSQAQFAREQAESIDFWQDLS